MKTNPAERILNIYKYVKSRQIKTEMFFFASLASVLVFYPSEKAMLVCALVIPVVFGGLKKGIPLGVIAALLAFWMSSTAMITDIKRPEGKTWLYSSTWGSVVASPGLLPGDLIKGHCDKKIYSFVKPGRFARGYYIFDRIDSVKSLKPAAWILKKREQLSDDLFYRSGGKVFLTQALALGDRRHMPPDIQDLFSITGLGHLLAVSGLHAGLYGGLIYMLFFFLPGKLRMIPVIISMFLQIPFTGFKVTVIRAGLLVIFAATAKLMDYYTDLRKLLLFFAGFFMLVSPSIAGDISFILSFSAVYGLTYLKYVKASGMRMSIYVGLASSVCIMPAASAVFGTFNISSVISTIILIPVVTLQIMTFLVYVLFPSWSVYPVQMLDNIHLAIVGFFADHSDSLLRIYKPDTAVIIFMILFILFCLKRRSVMAACVLLLAPYLPGAPVQTTKVHARDGRSGVYVERIEPLNHGAYFQKMVRSKGFVVINDRVHVFFKGNYGDFKYKFLPFLQKLDIYRADTGTIQIYNGANRLFKIKAESDDYGGICVNKTGKGCLAVFHTRSNTYSCDDEKTVHILYNNKKKCANMYLIKNEGDLILDENTYKRR